MGKYNTENYFFDAEKQISPKKLLVLIIYDIIENKKRTKFAKHLEGYGIRVQKSAFEARLTKKKYEKLLSEIPRFCGEEDSIRVYRISGQSQISIWGTREVPPDEEDIIVI